MHNCGSFLSGCTQVLLADKIKFAQATCKPMQGLTAGRVRNMLQNAAHLAVGVVNSTFPSCTRHRFKSHALMAVFHLLGRHINHIFEVRWLTGGSPNQKIEPRGHVLLGKLSWPDKVDYLQLCDIMCMYVYVLFLPPNFISYTVLTYKR